MHPKKFNAIFLLLGATDRGIVCSVYVVVRAYICRVRILNLGVHNLCPEISQRRVRLHGIHVH